MFDPGKKKFQFTDLGSPFVLLYFDAPLVSVFFACIQWQFLSCSPPCCVSPSVVWGMWSSRLTTKLLKKHFQLSQNATCSLFSTQFLQFLPNAARIPTACLTVTTANSHTSVYLQLYLLFSDSFPLYYNFTLCNVLQSSISQKMMFLGICHIVQPLIRSV